MTGICRTILLMGWFTLSFLSTSGCAAPPSAARPFSDQSPWNARPVNFKLGDVEVPKSLYTANVAEGAFSVGVFDAVSSDPPVVVRGTNDAKGIWIADAEVFAPSIEIAHWPAGVVPATGGDGHADIVDAAANRIHSFYQLRFVDGQWRAAQYTWTALDGRGWGDAAHYFQGSRAAGVPTMAGIIRSQEVNDGQPNYRHALAMSMPYNALAADPAYTFPATSADIDAAKKNHGTFPEGSLMMLPRDFDLTAIKDPRLQKVARTLQIYGAYVVDANGGSPYVIYVEIGSNFRLMQPGVWDLEIAHELEKIRIGLRQVVAATAWEDADGKAFVPARRLNLLSMRGPWKVTDGSDAGVFDSWRQAVLFPSKGRQIVQVNASGHNMHSVSWADPKPGDAMVLEVIGAPNCSLQLDLVDAGGQIVMSSGSQNSGTTFRFRWPAEARKAVVTVKSDPTGAGAVKGRLVVQSSTAEAR